MNKNKLTQTSRLMMDEAHSRGIECEIIEEDTLIMRKQGKKWYTRGSKSSFQSSVGCSIALRKDLTKSVLKHFDIPTAKYVVVKNIDQIEKILELQFPLVMKPFAGSEGAGVIVGIKSLEEAKDHFLRSNSTDDDYVIFEETLSGKEYRIVCVDHVFVAAAYRKAAFVVGDGKKTIKELIDEKNSHPWRGTKQSHPLTKIEVDDVVISLLKTQNVSLDYVPKAKQEITLRKTANISTGGEPHNVSSLVCAENKQLFEKISNVCDLDTIGIDILCQSLELPITRQQNAGVIEVNSAPYLRMHHFPLKGEPIDVASLILDMIEKKAQVS